MASFWLSEISGNSPPGELPSLRLRKAWSNQECPPLNRASHFREEESTEEGDADLESPKDLRGKPLTMALKRAVWQAWQMQATADSSKDSWKRKKAKTFQKVRNNIMELLYSLTLWRKSLQKIGGNFGGGVQSYFVFLRFLVVLNFVSFLLIAAFVLIPSIVFKSVESSYTNSTGPEDCRVYEPRPPGLVLFYNYFLDLLSGTGFMEYSYLFYGYYSNTMVEDRNFSYNIPLAYLFTALFYFGFCLLWIVLRMGRAVRVAVATGGGDVGNYSLMMFTGWDYSCMGDQATKLKQKNIHYRLQVDLEEQRIKRRAAALTLCQRITLYSLRVLMGILSLGLICSAFFCIGLATYFSQQNSDKEGILGLVLEYLPSIVITTGNFLVPLLCDQIAKVEKYSPSNTVIVALLRAVVLRLLSLVVLLYTLWSQITCGGDKKKEECSLCHYNHRDYPCWETRVGQEMYKLTLFDVLIHFAMLILVEFPRRILVDHSSSKLAQWLGRQEFVIPANVLLLVYGQTVVWTGALFCPLLPLINTIKFICLFYFKKITLFYNCQPAHKTFRSTNSAFFFLLVLFIGWCWATAVMVYSLAGIHPSFSCGPFRFFPTMWSIIPTSFHGLRETTQEFLFFVGSQAFLIPVFVLAVVGLCYFISLSSVYGNSVALMRLQLKRDSRDKQFLVKQIDELSKKTSHPYQECY